MTVAFVDVGQTGLRIESAGRVRSVARVGERLASPTAVARLADDIVATAERGVDELHVGATGVGDPGIAGDLARELVVRGARRAIVASDRVCGFLGALGDADGVALTAGTGVVGFAVASGRTATVGGAGWAIDDEGGGFWIGRRGLLAALRGHDGRGPATALTPAAVEAYGEPGGWPARIANNGAAVATVAGFVPAVAAAAAHGDPIARGIWMDAAAVLAEVVVATWRAAGGSGRTDIVVVGGLSRAGAVFTGPLAERLEDDSDSIRFVDDAALAGVRQLDRHIGRPVFGPYIATSEDS